MWRQTAKVPKDGGCIEARQPWRGGQRMTKHELSGLSSYVAILACMVDDSNQNLHIELRLYAS